MTKKSTTKTRHEHLPYSEFLDGVWCNLDSRCSTIKPWQAPLRSFKRLLCLGEFFPRRNVIPDWRYNCSHWPPSGSLEVLNIWHYLPQLMGQSQCLIEGQRHGSQTKNQNLCLALHHVMPISSLPLSST